MPKSYPAEFRLRAVALVRAGKTIAQTASELGVSVTALNNWIR
jgi:transposase-like protein